VIFASRENDFVALGNNIVLPLKLNGRALTSVRYFLCWLAEQLSEDMPTKQLW